jgi:hypothetical protein
LDYPIHNNYDYVDLIRYEDLLLVVECPLKLY